MVRLCALCVFPAVKDVLSVQRTPVESFSSKAQEACMPAKKKSSRAKSGRRKYRKGASKTVESALRRRKRGTLESGRGGRGGTVKSRKQAIAIGLSEARKKGAQVPRKKAA